MPCKHAAHGAKQDGCTFPTVGVELTGLPWNLMLEGKFNTKVPALMGYNKDEGTIGIAGLPGFKKGFRMYVDIFFFSPLSPA